VGFCSVVSGVHFVLDLVEHISECCFGNIFPSLFQWNSHGYDVAKWFGAKFTHISPVWLQIKRKPGGAFVIEGGHDIDKST